MHGIHHFYSKVKAQEMQAVQSVGEYAHFADGFQLAHLVKRISCIVLFKNDHTKKKCDHQSFKNYCNSGNKNIILEQRKYKCKHIYHDDHWPAHIDDESFEPV